jgi:hemerythrin superfamily protein
MNSLLHSLARFKTPEGLRLGHDEARAELVRASAMQGRVAEAVGNLADICLPHFEHEEKFVFPIFCFLHELADGNVTPEMAIVVPMVTRFNVYQKVFERQHQVLSESIDSLMRSGYSESNREIIEFAYSLRAHERMEHEVIYPMVNIIGKFVQQKLGI